MTSPRTSPSQAVLVVGAGGSGLVTALELARRGTAVRLVDASPAPCTESRGNGLQARTLELLDLHSVTDELLMVGNPVTSLTVFAGDTRLTEVDYRLAPSRFNSLVVPQSTTEGILRRRLADHGVAVEWGTRLVALAQSDDRVVASLRHADGVEESAACDWLVGADGAGSTVRKMLGLSFDGVSFEERWGLMDVTLDWELPADRIRVYRTPGGAGQLVTVPLGGRRYRVQSDDIARDQRAAPTLEQMQEIFDRCSAVPGTLSSPEWASSFQVHCRQVVSYRDRRVFLAGDAAHIHTPAGGQGLNTGIQDGINLGWKLAMVAGGHAGVELLDSYEQERAPVAAAVLRLTEALAREPGRVSSSHPDDMARTAAVVSQCAITYRDGPLVGETPGTARDEEAVGLRPGDRLPDLPLGDDRLYERLRTGRVVVAVLGGADAGELSSWPVDVWHLDADEAAPLAAAVGAVSGTDAGAGAVGVVIIRPDGHLGLVVGPAQAAEPVRAYLRDVLHLVAETARV